MSKINNAQPFVFLLVVFMFCSSTILAQKLTVSGHVKDQTSKPISFANVLLLKKTDTSIVAGSTADENGKFSIGNIKKDTYYIRASYIRNTTKLRRVVIIKDKVLAPLILETSVEKLDEVVVSTLQPKLIRKTDRLVFNVENTVVSESNTWEILKKTPGVILVQNQLMIRNRAATIYLNNRKVQLTSDEIESLLKGIGGNGISSIEIIHSPPASYDASDGPILNIVTNKAISLGYKGSITGNYTQAVLPKFGLSTSHYYKTNKLNVFANYSISPKRELKKDDGGIHYINNNNINFANWESDFKKVTKSAAQNITSIIDYKLSKKESLNFTGTYSFSPSEIAHNEVFVSMKNGQNILDSTQVTNSRLDADKNNLGLDFTYKRNLKKEGATLSINTHITLFNEAINQTVNSNYFNTTNNFLNNINFATETDKDITIYTAQIDYSTPWGSTVFKTGLKGAIINSESGIDYFNLAQNTPVLITSLSDVYNYKEKAFAAYSSLAKEWESWSLKTGLRLEYIDASGDSERVKDINTQENLELFPTVHLNYSKNENHGFSLDYSRRIQRPQYQDLNPFAYFLSENDFRTGNPNLSVSFSHNFNFNYTLKNTYFFDIYYRDNGRSILNLSFQDNIDQTLVNTKQNALESTSYGLDFTYAKSVKNYWYTYLYSSLFWEENSFIAQQSGVIPYTNKINGFYVQWANYLTLSKDGTFGGDVSLSYISKFILGSYIQDANGNLSIGLRKSLWKKRAIVSLTFDDIFNAANATLSSKYLNQDNFYFPRPETQLIRVGFTYKFGNFRLTDNKRGLSHEERSRID